LFYLTKIRGKYGQNGLSAVDHLFSDRLLDMLLDCNGKSLDLGRPGVMGILNVTPDSFSDGGKYDVLDAAVEQALKMQEEGAAIIDIGGESTRPGAPAVNLQQELDRVLPVIGALSGELDIPISIDTSKPQVMRAAVAAGAGMINDVNGLNATGAVEAAKDTDVPVCIMHMQGQPRTMQQAPGYHDVVSEVRQYLSGRMAVCEAAGIPRHHLIIDPGFGFGKTLEHNLALLAELESFRELGVPVLVGISRKSMIGQITGRLVDDRLPGSLAAAVMGVERGANIVRVHDVAATVDALKFTLAVIHQRRKI
jgi:dihydropteroate synthase